MISEPKFKISKFIGMSDQGGMYYMDGFSIEKEQGLTSIDENYLCSETVNSGTTNYSDLGSVMAIHYMYPLPDSNTGYGGIASTIMLNGSALLFSYDIFNQAYHGKIGGTASTGNYLYCQKPDIFQLPSGNLIYTSSRHLSLGIRGLVKTGSSTTTIIDKDGRNFVTLGVATGDTVTNLKTGSIYTITAIGDGDATNDKLTFTAIGTTDNSENNEFLLIILDRWDFNYVNGSSGTTVTIPTYQGQPSQVYWARPIRQWNIGDIAKYMILSGNYIALLSDDESTIDCAYKQLPTGYQGITFEINGSQILVSAFDVKGQSHLLLWDGKSDGWLEDRLVATAPACIKAYESGFIYLLDGVIYYTDGINIQKLIAFPDNVNLGTKANCPSPNSIAVLNDKIYLASNNNNYHRGIYGVLVFDKETGLTQFKCKYNGTGFASVNCVYVKSNTNIGSIYSTSNDIEIGCDYSLNNLNEFQGDSSTRGFRSFVYMLDFGQETQIKQVWLNLKRTSKKYFSTRADKNSTISVNYGNDNSPLIKYASLNSTNTTTLVNPNAAYYPGIVGEEVEMTTDSRAGERTFITAIANPGEANETWTISPALSGTFGDGSQARIWSVKNGETKNITLDDLNKPVVFNVNFLGSKMYLEIVTRGKTNPTTLSINDILLF